MNEYGDRKLKRREARLKTISGRLLEDFNRRNPDYAGQFEVVPRIVRNHYSGTLPEGGTPTPPLLDARYFRFMLVPTSNKRKSRGIMQVYPTELDSHKKPAPGITMSESPLSDEKLREAAESLLGKGRNLEGTLGIITISALLLSILFVTNITGNVIGNSATSNIIGVVLFLIGILGAFLYFRRK